MSNTTTTEATTTAVRADLFTTATTAEIAAEAYATADAKTKAAMRAGIKEAISAAVRTAEFGLAQHLVEVVEPAFKVAKAAPAGPDYAQAIADRRATLVSAIEALDAGDFNLPEGTEAPTAEAIAERTGTVDAKFLSVAVSVAGRKSGRGNVAAWIDSVLGDEPTTIADLRAAWTATEDYPKAAPSAGAIGACLDRDGAAEFGIEATDLNGVKAAVRVEA